MFKPDLLIFSDASYSPQGRFGVIGYIQIAPDLVVNCVVSELVVHIQKVLSQSNSNMEILALIWALESLTLSVVNSRVFCS